jgi:hypothetical protein
MAPTSVKQIFSDAGDHKQIFSDAGDHKQIFSDAGDHKRRIMRKLNSTSTTAARLRLPVLRAW